MLGLESISKSNPLLAYFFMGQIILFCTALLVGALLLLKRLIKQQPFEGDPNFDNGRIAQEIQQEILKLKDLRNRLDPSLAALDHDSAAAGAAPTAAGGETVDRAALEKEIAAKYAQTILALEEELKKAKAAAGEQKAGEAAKTVIPEGYLSPEQVKAEIAKALAAAGGGASKQNTDDLQLKISQLEKVLSEYKVFEEDFALVKKYKAENDEFKRQLGGAPTPTPDATVSSVAPAASQTPAAQTIAQVDAASPLGEGAKISLSAAAPVAAPTPVAAAPSPAAEAAAPASAEVQLTESDLNGLFDDIKKKPIEAPSAPSTDASVAAPSVDALNKALDEKGTEAAAEGTDENLMAEFEKLLNAPEVKS